MKVKREKGIVVAVDIVGQEASKLCGAIGELDEGNFALKLGRPLEKMYSMNVIEWVKQQTKGFCGKDVVKAVLDLNQGEVIVVTPISLK